MDAVTGQPIAGAVVESFRSFVCWKIAHSDTRSLEPRETVTDERGRYRFKHDWRLPPCLFGVEEERGIAVLAPGYRERYVFARDWETSGGRVRLHRLTSRSQPYALTLPSALERQGPLWRAAVAESLRVGPPSPQPPGAFVVVPGVILDQVVAYDARTTEPWRLVMARDARTGTLHAWKVYDGTPVPMPLEGGGWSIRVFAVTGDENYFFTEDGAPDERIDRPTAAEQRLPP